MISRMAAQDVSECLDDGAIAAFIAGELVNADLLRVETHLASCGVCCELAATVAHIAFDASGSIGMPELGPGGTAAVAVALANQDEPPVLACGDIVSAKYRIDERIGAGGMSEVFCASHLELGHRVALKVLQRVDADTSLRFLREAQICARLRNEHLVQVFDIGRLPAGAPYLVMEHLVGEDLARALARGPLEPSVAASYLLQAGVAVQAAHAAGVVHRDLKPANLFLVTRKDQAPQLKVLDFGISRYLDGTQNVAADARPGAIIGSPSYMSPEQWLAPDAADARSDIWSLGVILYEALTGRTPFHATTFAGLGAAIAGETPVPPSALCPDLPSGLEATILHCLAKDPDDRFQSVTDFMASLAPYSALPARPSGVYRSAGLAAPSPADEWEIYEQTADALLAAWRDVFVVIWQKETSARDVQKCAQYARRLARHSGRGVALLSIIEAGSPPPSGDARKAIVNLFVELAPLVHCSAVVFEAVGFRASMIRSVVTGLSLAARPRFPHRICRLEEAAAWFASSLPERTGQPFSKAEFLSAIAELRARSRTAQG